MAIILQASTLAGKLIEAGKWSVEFEAGVQEGHSVALNIPIPTAETGLVNYLSKQPSTDAMLDKNEDGYNVAVSFRVARVRHMVETKDGSVESMAILQPANKLVESVITYLLAPKMCDTRFLRAIRGDLSSQ